MRIAAIYDLHGNLPALEAILADARREGVDAIVAGGDILPGPMVRESLELLLGLDLPVQFIQGNGEIDALAEMSGTSPVRVPPPYREIVRWSAMQMHPEYESVLAGWPKTLSVDVEGLGEVLFCHATPRDDNELFTVRTPEERLTRIFEESGAPLVVCGHTHMQFDRRVGTVRVVNAGSAGMPFGAPGADWLLLGPRVELRHTSYDLDAAAARIRATSYPDAEAFVEKYLLHPPDAETMLEVFTRAGL